MAEVADDGFDVHGDDRLVLYDQDVGKGLPLDLLERLGDERLDVGRACPDQVAGIVRREAFERRQQQRLARQRGDPRQPCLGDSLCAGRAFRRLLAFLDIGSRPDRVEGPVQAQARIDVAGEFVGLGDDGFERRADERVAVRLAAGQRTRIAAKEGQVRSKFLAKRHRSGSPSK